MSRIAGIKNGKLVPCECCSLPTCSACGHCCFHRDSIMTVAGANVPSTADDVLDAAIAAWEASSYELTYTPFQYVGCGDYSLVIPFAVEAVNYRLVVYVNIQATSILTPVEEGTPTTRAFVQVQSGGSWTEYGELWNSSSETEYLQSCCEVSFPDLLDGFVGSISGNLCCRDSEGNCTDAEGEPDCAGNCFWDCTNNAQCCISKYSWLLVKTTGNLSVSYAGADAYYAEGVSQWNALDKETLKLGTSFGNPSVAYYYVIETDKVVVGSYEVWLKIEGGWNFFSGGGFTTVAPYWEVSVMRRSTGVGDGSAYLSLLGATMNSIGGPVNGSCCGGTCPIYLTAAGVNGDFSWTDSEPYTSNAHRSVHTVQNNYCCASPDGESVSCNPDLGRCDPEEEDGVPTGYPFNLPTDGWCDCECLCPPDLPATLTVNWTESVWNETTEEYDEIPHTQELVYDSESCSYSGGGFLLAWNPAAHYCGGWEWYEDSAVVSVNQGNDCISPVGFYSDSENSYEVTE